MYKAYKFRLYPSDIQKTLIHKTFGCYRFIYNYFLEKGIRMAGIIADVFEELVEVIPKDVEKLVILTSEFKLICRKKQFPKLKEVISSSYLQLHINTLEEELEKVIKLNFPTKGRLGEL